METINHEYYVSLEVAKLLKEAGFDWKVQSYYSKLSRKQGRLLWLACGCLYKENININQNRYSAPTLDVAQRWLREVNNMHIQIDMHMFSPTDYGYAYAIMAKVKRKGLDKGKEIEYDALDCLDCETSYNTYEEALSAGILKCLTLLLEKV